MKLRLMAFYDQAAAAYLAPFAAATQAVALRQVHELPNKDPSHDFVKYSDQFTLFDLGSFDNETGKVESAEGPVSLGTCQSIIAR